MADCCHGNSSTTTHFLWQPRPHGILMKIHSNRVKEVMSGNHKAHVTLITNAMDAFVYFINNTCVQRFIS